jgi:hypothetical protein
MDKLEQTFTYKDILENLQEQIFEKYNEGTLTQDDINKYKELKKKYKSKKKKPTKEDIIFELSEKRKQDALLKQAQEKIFGKSDNEETAKKIKQIYLLKTNPKISAPYSADGFFDKNIEELKDKIVVQEDLLNENNAQKIARQNVKSKVEANIDDKIDDILENKMRKINQQIVYDEPRLKYEVFRDWQDFLVVDSMKEYEPFNKEYNKSRDQGDMASILNQRDNFLPNEPFYSNRPTIKKMYDEDLIYDKNANRNDLFTTQNMKKIYQQNIQMNDKPLPQNLLYDKMKHNIQLVKNLEPSPKENKVMGGYCNTCPNRCSCMLGGGFRTANSAMAL